MALSGGVSLAFLRDLLKVSTKRSAWPLLLVWNGAIVIRFTENVWQNSLNSLDMNWIPLSEVMQSTTIKRANNSCKKMVTTSVVASKNFRPFWKAVYYNQVCRNHLVDQQNRCGSYTTIGRFLARGWVLWGGLWRQSTTFAGFYSILDYSVHICSIVIASYEAFNLRHSGMADMKFF